ncbi:probable E3 ubiquitin-protein ligase LUL4 [Prunus avium]|uniref:RING-type E3 ubiquitin transferase n=1 Tax=Prunus avium TaxID=42229 RepID=A0A6P5TNU6_PRUAV|nr:probable E3 ubiquitin-protein ligase LUL4 [Prunus avium]
MSALEDQLKATFKLFVAAQNVAAHRDFDRGKRDEQAMTMAELNRTYGEKAKVEEELELVRVNCREAWPRRRVVRVSEGAGITVFYFAKEEPDCRFVPLFPEAFVPVRVPFQKVSGQKFRQPSGTGIDLGFFELDDLSKPSPGEDVFPLVISAETFPPHSTDEHIVEATPDTSPRMQITQAVLEKNNGDHFQVRVIRQILWIDEVRYELREIYGIASSTVEGFDDNDPGKECVICMTEPKDTAVLPCRHMCMCSDCAKELTLQSNKCPICRQPIQELIGIEINKSRQ